MENKNIKRIYVDHIGHIYAKAETPIEIFSVNGEMALVFWYRCGNSEYNGKYVVEVEYD
jgi:hypothetical protein